MNAQIIKSKITRRVDSVLLELMESSVRELVAFDTQKLRPATAKEAAVTYINSQDTSFRKEGVARLSHALLLIVTT